MQVKDFARKYDFALPLYLRGLLVDRELYIWECWKPRGKDNKYRFTEHFADADCTIRQIQAAPDKITLTLK